MEIAEHYAFGYDGKSMTTKQVVTREIFYFISVLAGLAIILEIIWPNIILAYFNLNWLFTLWLISGLSLFIKK